MQHVAHHLHRAGKWKNSVPIDIAKPTNKPILLYFWRSHTSESVETLLALDEFIQMHGDRLPVTTIAIHAPEFDEASDPWEALVENLGIKLPIFHDPKYDTWELFGVQNAPAYILLNTDGEEVLRRVGNLETSGVMDHLLSLA
jgi:hypothetical protein